MLLISYAAFKCNFEIKKVNYGTCGDLSLRNFKWATCKFLHLFLIDFILTMMVILNGSSQILINYAMHNQDLINHPSTLLSLLQSKIPLHIFYYPYQWHSSV